MAFQVSPGVQVKEIDATGGVPAVSSSIGGFAGAFNTGPVGKIITVSSEKELAAIFGTPDDTTYKHFLTAASFLKYGQSLKVVRAEGAAMLNATADASGHFVGNDEDYDSLASSLSKGPWIAKYPGELYNGIEVAICPADTTAFTAFTQAGEFSGAPGTSDYATSIGYTSAADELHVVVIDKLGKITGTPDAILETFDFVSQASDAKSSDGSSLYYRDVINNKSDYIRFLDHVTELSGAGTVLKDESSTSFAFVTGTAVITDDLGGGADANSPTSGEISTALELFDDAETVDVNLLFAYPDADGEDVIAKKLISICEARKDCMAFVSPPIEDSRDSDTPATDVVAWVNGLPSTSYAAADSTSVYVYDKYNDVYRWIGAAGYQAGLCANADSVADAWFSPAGVNRGQLLGITKLAYNPKKADRDTLYKARTNPIVSFPGQGTILYGDKTLLSRTSAFDRINVRRLFILLEKAIAKASKAQLFEFNDEFTRAQFRNLVEPFLRDIKGRRGITDFAVICDDTNNDGQVIDSNRFVADIYIKPARSINFITLNFIATRTGVDFSEIAGV